MTMFWIICAVLLMVALLFVVLPLWRSSGKNCESRIQRDAANLEILRDQSAELDIDLRNGLLTRDAYEQGKHELQARLLEEVRTTAQPAQPLRCSAKGLAIALAILLPVFSIPIYLAIGSSGAVMSQLDVNAVDSSGVIRSDTTLRDLEKRMEKTPENPDGWFMLARTYTQQQRYPDAARAYQKLVELVPNEAHLWASYADVYAMSNNRSMQGEPTRLVNKALELDSNNPLALALSGTAAMERSDYVTAIAHWTRLVDLLPPDNAEVPMIQNGIKQAREFLAKQKGGKEKLAQLPSAKGVKKTSATSTITGKISISPKLAGKVAPADAVFIYARAANGPKFPLAVLRKEVKDLPFQFTLDDSTAMRPDMKISSFDQVVVLARVSRSGNAIAEPGDLEGASGAIKPGSKGLDIVIDSVVQ